MNTYDQLISDANQNLMSIAGQHPAEASIAGASVATAIATLAIAEQARISNLIAVYSLLDTSEHVTDDLVCQISSRLGVDPW